MPKAALVKRGKEYLHDVPLPKLEEMYRREPPGKSRDRLQAAVLRKRGRTLKKIAGPTWGWAGWPPPRRRGYACRGPTNCSP